MKLILIFLLLFASACVPQRTRDELIEAPPAPLTKPVEIPIEEPTDEVLKEIRLLIPDEADDIRMPAPEFMSGERLDFDRPEEPKEVEKIVEIEKIVEVVKYIEIPVSMEVDKDSFTWIVIPGTVTLIDDGNETIVTGNDSARQRREKIASVFIITTMIVLLFAFLIDRGKD